MKWVLGVSLALLAGTAYACPGMYTEKEITFIPQDPQSPALTQDQVDPKLFTQAEKQELKKQKAN